MKTMKRLLAVPIVSAVTAAAFMPMPAKAADGDITLSVLGVLTYQYQKPQKFVVNVKNNTTNDISNIVVSPDMKDDVSQWPFKTDYQKYEAKIDTLAAGETKPVEFNFTERDDVPSTRFTLLFKYTGDGGVSGSITGSQSFYVLTTAKPADKKASGQDESNKPAKKQEDSGSGGADAIPLAADAGGQQLYADHSPEEHIQSNQGRQYAF